jgi:hypothetical protein
MSEEITEEIKEEEIDGEIEFTYRIDYINGACSAMAAVDGIDTQILNKADELRVKRIKRKSLRILDLCISEFYDELFEDDEE